MKHDDIDLKQEFQLERIIFFSDAVFAIAITVLIIDIRIPYQEGITNRQLLAAVTEKIPELVGFLISFFFIGFYWFIHHKMFGYVSRFDTRLIWLNLIFLLSIVMLPFTTGIFGMYGNLTAAFCLYIINAVFAGIMNFFCWKHILKPSAKLTTVPFDRSFRRAAYFRALLTPSWFLICGLMALLFNVFVGEMMLPAVSILYAVLGRASKHKK